MAQLEVQNGGAEKVAAAAAVTFSSLKPQLFVEAPKAADAVQFYKSAFGAEEVDRTMHPKRKAEQELPLILCAQLKIGGSSINVCDLADDSSAPEKAPGATFSLCLETEDVDAAIRKAVGAGAAAEGEAVGEGDGACCGERVGKIKDPYGFTWLLCSSAKKANEEEA